MPAVKSSLETKGFDMISLFIREEALCSQSDPDLWFEERTSLAREAMSICNQCPVMEECRQFAIDNEVDYGIWGGMTTAQRRREVRIAKRKSQSARWAA